MMIYLCPEHYAELRNRLALAPIVTQYRFCSVDDGYVYGQAIVIAEQIDVCDWHKYASGQLDSAVLAALLSEVQGVV